MTSSIFKAHGSYVSTNGSRESLALNTSAIKGLEEDLANGLIDVRDDEEAIRDEAIVDEGGGKKPAGNQYGFYRKKEMIDSVGWRGPTCSLPNCIRYPNEVSTHIICSFRLPAWRLYIILLQGSY